MPPFLLPNSGGNGKFQAQDQLFSGRLHCEPSIKGPFGDVDYRLLPIKASSSRTSISKLKPALYRKGITKAKTATSRLKLSFARKTILKKSSGRLISPSSLRLSDIWILHQQNQKQPRPSSPTVCNNYHFTSDEDGSSASDTIECPDCREKELLAYPFEPWTSVSELIEVHSGIYSSLRYENIEFGQYGKRVYLNDDDNTTSDTTASNTASSRTNSKFYYSCDKLTQWKECLRSVESGKTSVIIFSHLIALESLVNALLESSKCTAGDGNGSVLYSLYSIAVINFCNALASYEATEAIVGGADSSSRSPPKSSGTVPLNCSTFAYQNSGGVLRKFAKILKCPSWIVTCRNNLSHSSSLPPSLNVLHEAITFAFEWMDRCFWSKVLADQCRLDVDMRQMPVAAVYAQGSDCESCKAAGASRSKSPTLSCTSLTAVPALTEKAASVITAKRPPLRPLNGSPTRRQLMAVGLTRRTNYRFHPYDSAAKYLLGKLNGGGGWSDKTSGASAAAARNAIDWTAV